MTYASVDRRHLAVLALLTLAFVLRGALWVALRDVPDPIDELQHLDYVVRIADGEGPPVLGRDKVDERLLELAKDAPTSWYQGRPVAPRLDDPGWGAGADSYEGVQGPAYYAVAALVWEVTEDDLEGGLYAVRLLSLLLAALTVPATWLLAREVAPDRPGVWLASAALVATVWGLVSNPATVTNDALALPVGTLTAWSAVAGLRRGLPWRWGLVTGAFVALALLTKSTLIGLIPWIGVAVVVVVLARRVPLGTAVTWTTATGVVSAVGYAPWVAFNLWAYGEPSAGPAVDAITGPLQPDLPLSPGAIWFHTESAVQGTFALQPTIPQWNRVDVAWFTAVAVSVLVVLVLRWRDRQEVAAAVWLASAWPAGFAAMLAIIYVAFHGRSSVVGRHLMHAVPPTAVLVALALSALAARRWWLPALALLGLGVAVVPAELDLTDRYARVVYTGDVLAGGLVPQVEQDRAEVVLAVGSVTIEPPCPAHQLALGTLDTDPPVAPPSTLQATVGGRSNVLSLVALENAVGQVRARYRLATPTAERIEIDDVPFPLTGVSRDIDGAVEASGGSDPRVTVWCPVADPTDARFAQLFHPYHADLDGLGTVRSLSLATAGLAVLLLAAAAWTSAASGRRQDGADRPVGERAGAPGDA